ncbi:DUF4145 domain-containing protein [Bifidobacterium choladohabitans]|uniref:DUF4145 domain-containing protein n=1 Tax=Bifidobacterium choladohabitans TaxID=2750947 RepID=UPI0018DBAF69|nr:DUF4145 domain-containing protein [Bifidobacterium choladohabitans]MBI0047293.1 DUF4145 domain-containing protein [Bifidobacterium choladohabitans]
MASRICWHCERFSHMTQIGPVFSDILKGKAADSFVWFAPFTCDACGYATLGMIDSSLLGRRINSGQAQSVFQVEADFEDEEEPDDEDEQIITWIPREPVWKEYEDVPEDIAAVASEAYSCCSIKAYRSAVLMARTALEATAKNKGITSGSLNEKIEELAEQNIITDQLAQEANEIRLLGNDMAHGDPDIPVSKEDASDILGFLDTVLDYVYQQPIAIQKRKALRKKRKENKNDCRSIAPSSTAATN